VVTETAKRLLKRVRTIREYLGLSQEAFAERAGLKYKHYQAVEAGRKTDIRISTLEKMAAACGLEPWQLLDFESDPIVVAEDAENARPRSSPRKIARPSGRKHSRQPEGRSFPT